jgi:hypothetical protein
METVIYRDFDMRFQPHPLTGDISRLNNADAVKQSLRNLLSLRRNDIPFETIPEVFNSVLFEQPDPILTGDVKKLVEWMIKSHEPRIKLTSVEVNINSNESEYVVTLNYFIRSLYQEDRLEYVFQRIR